MESQKSVGGGTLNSPVGTPSLGLNHYGIGSICIYIKQCSSGKSRHFLGGVDESQNVPSQHRLRNSFETKKPFLKLSGYFSPFKSIPVRSFYLNRWPIPVLFGIYLSHWYSNSLFLNEFCHAQTWFFLFCLDCICWK